METYQPKACVMDEEAFDRALTRIAHEVVEHNESADIGALALPKLVSQAIAANSAAIDGASGASMTTAGFREAVAAALELAK